MVKQPQFNAAISDNLTVVPADHKEVIHFAHNTRQRIANNYDQKAAQAADLLSMADLGEGSRSTREHLSNLVDTYKTRAKIARRTVR